MNALYIVTVYVVIADSLKAMGHQDDVRTRFTTAEVLTVAVIAAQYFHNHHERALWVLQRLGDVPRLSTSRFNRRLHQALPYLSSMLDELAQARLQSGALYVIDTFPLPVCHKVRAERCTKVVGKHYLGWCAAKGEWFYGLRLHWLCDRHGFPVSFDFLPAVWHELTPLQYLLAPLPDDCWVVADGAYISADQQLLARLAGNIRLVPQYHRRMRRGNSSLEQALLRHRLPAIETAHSRLHNMGVQHLHARTFDGFVGKVLASLLALACSLLMPN